MNLGNRNPINGTFGERLMLLMENDENGPIDTSKRGAAIELSRRMYNKKILEYSSDDYDIQGKNRDNARKLIFEHMKLDSAENISGKWLKAYCDYFKCSADYLLGYIPLPTQKETDIQKETGLSKSAIKILIEWNKTAHLPETKYSWARNARKAISDLIEQDIWLYRDVLNPIAEYCYYRKLYDNPDTKNKQRTMAQEKFRLALFTATNGLTDCIKAIYKNTKKAPNTT